MTQTEKLESDDVDENSEESYVRRNFAIIGLITAYIIYVSIALYVLLNPNQLVSEIWVEFKEYRNPLLTLLPIVIIAVSLFHIFYLGKLHDYKRDFIKQYGIFTEKKLLIERKYSSAEIKQHDEVIKAIEGDNEYYEETDDLFKSNPRDLFLSLGGVILLLVSSYLFLLREDLRSNEMLIILISIIFGFCLIPIVISQSEKLISEHDDDLKNVTQDIAYITADLD